MFCIWCGAPIDDDCQFCPQCGGGQAPGSPPPNRSQAAPTPSAPPQAQQPSAPQPSPVPQAQPEPPQPTAPQQTRSPVPPQAPPPQPPRQPVPPQTPPPQQPTRQAPPPGGGRSKGPLLGVLIAVICILAVVIVVLVLKLTGALGDGGSQDPAQTPEVSTSSVQLPEDSAGQPPSDAPTSVPVPSPSPSPTPTPTPTPSPSPELSYILPDSDKRYLTQSDLEGLTDEELRIARNEIYARHGRLFNDQELQAYFDQQPWYKGTIPAEEFTQDMLNDYEVQNASLILEYENGR